MSDTYPILLPALFGLAGTIVGGLLTIWGQHRADRRAHEKRSEEHYSGLATELINWLRERAKVTAEAAVLSGGQSRNRAQHAYDLYPLSDFVMRARTAFPELAPHIDAYAAHEISMMQFLRQVADEPTPFAMFNEKVRHGIVEKGAVIQRPLLAGLVKARAQVSLSRPKRLDAKGISAAADEQLAVVEQYASKSK